MNIVEKVKKDYRQGIEKLVKRKKLNGPCVIFSTDYFVKFYRDILVENGVNVIGIVDNDEKKWGIHCGGLPIMSVESVVGKEVTVLIASGLWRSMGAQLESLGFKENQNFFYVVLKEKDKYFLSISELLLRFYRFYRGVISIKKIQKKYGNNKIYFISPFPSLGDIYIATLFIPNFLNCKSIKLTDFVLIVLNKGCYKLSKALGYDNVEFITKNQSENIVFSMSASEGKVGINSIIHSAFFATRIYYLNSHTDATFSDLNFPYLFPTAGNDIITIPRFQPDINRIEQLFKEKELVDKKTVVISPYASSFVSDIDEQMWGKLVSRLLKNGYTVCTNCANEKETPLDRTISVNFPFEDSVAFLERAGGFIGVRSGLCDIISSAKCTKVFLYETGLVHNGYNFYSANRMGLCDDAIEYSYDGLNSDKHIEDIMGNFPPICKMGEKT